MPEEIISGDPIVEEKPGLIERVKSWPVSIALATGVAIGSAGTYQITVDKYDANADIVSTVEVVDTVKNIVDRPYVGMSQDSLKTGDVCRLVLFVNDKIYNEVKSEIILPPTGQNDAFTANISLYIHEDRIAPLPDTTEVK